MLFRHKTMIPFFCITSSILFLITGLSGSPQAVMSSAPRFWTTFSSSCSPSISFSKALWSKTARMKMFSPKLTQYQTSGSEASRPPQTLAVAWPLMDRLQAPPVLSADQACLWWWRWERSNHTRTSRLSPWHPGAWPLFPPEELGCHSIETPSGPAYLEQLQTTQNWLKPRSHSSPDLITLRWQQHSYLGQKGPCLLLQSERSSPLLADEGLIRRLKFLQVYIHSFVLWYLLTDLLQLDRDRWRLAQAFGDALQRPAWVYLIVELWRSWQPEI